MDSVLWPVVMVFVLWIWRFRCRFPGTGIWHFPALVFCFLSRRGSGGAGDLFGFFFADLLPFVGRCIFRIAESQAKQIRLAPIGIAGAAGFGDFHKTERNDFANGGCRTGQSRHG